MVRHPVTVSSRAVRVVGHVLAPAHHAHAARGLSVSLLPSATLYRHRATVPQGSRCYSPLCAVGQPGATRGALRRSFLRKVSASRWQAPAPGVQVAASMSRETRQPHAPTHARRVANRKRTYNYALKLTVQAARPLLSPGRTLLRTVTRKGRATRPAAYRERSPDMQCARHHE